MMHRRRHTWTSSALVALTMSAILTYIGLPAAHAEELTPVPATISGHSPDGLGTWTVHYQRIDGGDPVVATAINHVIDAKAMEGVQRATWDGSTRRPWNFGADGKSFIGPITVAEIFTDQYDTAEPNMPMQSVAGVVCDRRSGLPIAWDNLFVDKRAGLTRLGDETAARVAAVAPAKSVRDWRRQGAFAPVDINFKAWKPTSTGIDLHFPEFQFGRGLKMVTIPWSNLADLIRPEFSSIMS